MTTDNRTNEPTEAQVEAAAKVLLRDYQSEYDGGEVSEFLDVARAALVAAQGAAPQAPVLNPDYMSVMNGYLVLSVNEHTCGTGPDGHYGAHEPGCGYEPLVNLAEIPGYPADAAAAMDRVNRLHQTVLRGNSMLGEELEAWCVHCNIPAPCHTVQALGPVLPSSGVDEDKLRPFLKNLIFQYNQERVTLKTATRYLAEWLKGQGGGSRGE